MGELDALTGRGVYRPPPGAPQGPPFVEATIATSAASVDAEVFVLIKREDSQLRAGPCRWEPIANGSNSVFPTRGDDALVVLSDHGHHHVVWWKPAAPPDPILGQRGALWTSMLRAPTGADAGLQGDEWLDTSTGDVYMLGVSSWVLTGNIRGPQGVAGATGPAGATGATGATGPAGTPGTNGTNGTNGNTVRNGSGAPSAGLGVNGDFYIDTAAWKIYGPKTAGAWGSGTSLIGPAIGTFRLPINYVIGDAVAASTIVPEVPVLLAPGQTAAIVSVFSHITSGTSIDVQLRRNGASVGSAITVTTAAAVTALSQALAANDVLDLVLSTPVGSPKDLTFSIVVEHTA